MMRKALALRLSVLSAARRISTKSWKKRSHISLERTIRSFTPPAFHAKRRLFETILTADDAVISDELNHASIIDGVRLCKAKRFRYKNNNMEDLEAQLQAADAAGARIKLIATDGVFSMDGIICNLKGVCDLADKYNALVMVDDSHAVGFIGKHGRGTPEHCGVEGRVRYYHRNARKSTGRSKRRIYVRKKRNYRFAAPKKQTVPFFKLPCAGDCRSKYRDVQHA